MSEEDEDIPGEFEVDLPPLEPEDEKELEEKEKSKNSDDLDFL